MYEPDERKRGLLHGTDMYALWSIAAHGELFCKAVKEGEAGIWTSFDARTPVGHAPISHVGGGVWMQTMAIWHPPSDR